MGNRERIVQASLELFNERGTSSVTTNHIAAHLSISPGNLYYHFGNKEEIIRAIFPRFSEAVHATIVLPEDREVAAADLGRYHLAGVETLWEFRFFFWDPKELLARDPVLAEPYQELRQWLVDALVALFRRLIAQRVMRPPEPAEDLARVATNSFILWSTWVGFVITSQPEREVDRSDMVDGALQSFLTFSPYLDPGFAAEARAVLEERARDRGSTAPESRGAA
jgi:AcrR family transcriptional regulator